MKKWLRRLFKAHKVQSHRIYISPSWKQQAELLSHLIEYSQNLLLMIAPHQGGKSTFLKYLITRLPDSVHPGVFRLDANTTITDFVESLKKEAKQKPVVLVDDAHNITQEQLKALIALSADELSQAMPCRFVLLGEPALEASVISLESKMGPHRLVYTTELEPWTRQDIYHYYVKECHQAISSSRLQQELERTQGLPGRVIQARENIADHPTLEPKMEKTTMKTQALQPIAIGALAGVLIGGLYLYYNGMGEEVGQAGLMNFAQSTKDTWAEQEMSGQQSQDRIAFQFDSRAAEVVDGHDEVSRMMPLAENIPMVEVTPKPAVDLASKPAVDLASKPSQVMGKKFVPEVVSRVPVKSEARLALTAQEKHLLSVAKNRYTLQLLGTQNEENAKKFVERFALTDQSYRFKTQHAGKDWFVVVYGDYSSKTDAKKAIQSMPAGFKHEKVTPWVRQIGSVQQEIRDKS